MTNLTKLTVSLTKHGAHKIAILLKKYDSKNILMHLSDSVPGVNIERAQAIKNLSANSKEIVPDVWDEARGRGDATINALVLIGIIFSHYSLIKAMRDSTSAHVPFTGSIIRGEHLSGKAFTNFAHTIEELGYSTKHSKNHVDYNLQKLFDIDGLNELAIKLLALKLQAAGWDGRNSVVDELLAQNFHEVFSISNVQFQQWLLTGDISKGDSKLAEADMDFFTKASDFPSEAKFEFKPGHRQKKTGKVGVAKAKTDITADLLHNQIQNKLYEQLVKKYGAESVGTEVPTGDGTSVDVVVKTFDFCWFYEIKTAESVKACIRQAIPQLLEYAYWQGKDDKANRLIIISPLPLTKGAEIYLNFLSKQFKLPLFYEQFKA